MAQGFCGDTLVGKLVMTRSLGKLRVDDLNGGRGRDLLAGGSGGDVLLDGGSDDDVVRGGQGRDLFTMEPGNDSIHGGGDRDTIAAPVGLRTQTPLMINLAAGVATGTFGHDAIHQIENVDLEWNKAVSIIGTDGQPDPRVGPRKPRAR